MTMTRMQQRIEMRRTFKDVLENLRKLDRHFSKVKMLDEEEIEHLAISVDFAMDEICETINSQLAEFGIIELPEETTNDKKRSGTDTKSLN